MTESVESGAALDRWLRTEAIFHEAVGLAEPARTAALQRTCGSDTALMEELRALMQACDAEEAHRAGSLERTDTNVPAQRIGPYTVDRLLGRGGMGAVYLAHRADGQFEQQVAIKLIDLPLATEVFRERFRAERQMLAGLVHPYIARLLDGGVSDAGELYLAMEFVDGVSITAFCENRGLGLRERLELFRKVCEAVQFAHGNLIVHRDLKPDNILVVEDGTPRLLDFGTAKLLAAPGQVGGDLTQAGMQSFTPRYASPEQVLGLPIGIASDVYSLGVLLYVLLTGEQPYKLQEFTTEEMVRVICQKEPLRPSSADARIDRDLDCIVLKALRKAPAERYATVEQMSSDVVAWLAGRPVQARQGNLRYVAAKFVRRNLLALTAVAVLAVTLLAGVAGVLWQSRVANEQRRRADARAADLRELSKSLLSELNEALKDIPGSTGAQKLLVTRVVQSLDNISKDARGDRQSALDVIDAYTRLGNVQANIYYQNLADTPGALSSFDKALALARPLVAAGPSDKEAVRALAATLEARGEVLSDTGDPSASTASLQEAVDLYDRFVRMPGVTSPQIFEAAIATEVLGNELCEDTGMADAAGGIAAYQKAMAMDEVALRIDPAYIPVRRGLPVMHVHIGNVELETAPARALEEFQLALRLHDALPETERKKLRQMTLRAVMLRKEGQAYAELGKYSLAEPILAESTQAFQRLSDADPKNVAALADLWRVLDAQATCYEYAADPALADVPGDRRKNLMAAEAALERVAKTVRRIMEQDTAHARWKPELAQATIRLGAVRAAMGKPAGDAGPSLAVLRAAAERPKASADDMDQAATAYLTAEPAGLGNADAALTWAEQGVAMTRRRSPGFLLLLARAYRASGQAAKAEAAAREGLSLLPKAEAGRLRTLLDRQLSEPGKAA